MLPGQQLCWGQLEGAVVRGRGSKPSCSFIFPWLQHGKESGRNSLLLGSDNRNSRARSGPAVGASHPFQRPPGRVPFSPVSPTTLHSLVFWGAPALGAGLAAP